MDINLTISAIISHDVDRDFVVEALKYLREHTANMVVREIKLTTDMFKNIVIFILSDKYLS